MPMEQARAFPPIVPPAALRAGDGGMRCEMRTLVVVVVVDEVKWLMDGLRDRRTLSSPGDGRFSLT